MEWACRTKYDFLSYTPLQIPEVKFTMILYMRCLRPKFFMTVAKFSIKYMICSFRLTECNHYLDHHHHPYGNDIGLSRWHRMQMSICCYPLFFCTPPPPRVCMCVHTELVFLYFFHSLSLLFVLFIVSDEYAFSMIAECPEWQRKNEIEWNSIQFT